MEHTSLDPNLHGTEPAPLSAQPACETICAPVTTQHPCADVQDFSASSFLLMEHTSQDPNSHGTEPAPLSAQPACETICAPVTTQLPSADIPDFSASSSLLMEHSSLDPNLHGTEPAPLSAQPACETICAPVTTQLPSADVQDFSASSSLLMEHTSLEGVDSGFENRESDIVKGDMYNGSSTDSETDPPTHQRRTCKRIRNQVRQNDDTDEETDDEVHATKRVCIRKIKWTEEEVSTITTAFGHLLMKGLLPGYRQIESLQDKKKCLQRRSKAQIKSKCHQLINKEY